MTMTVSSSAWDAGGGIPRKYTGEGDDVSPPIAWSGVPTETSEIAILCDDPDAPRPKPWVHWVIAGIPSDRTSLREGESAQFVEGRNDFGNLGYGGPMPPPGHGVHHYHFRVFALRKPLGLSKGVTKETSCSERPPQPWSRSATGPSRPRCSIACAPR